MNIIQFLSFFYDLPKSSATINSIFGGVNALDNDIKKNIKIKYILRIMLMQWNTIKILKTLNTICFTVTFQC